MKFLIIFAFFAGAFGQYASPDIRITSSYSHAPALLKSFEAPVLKSAYEAPLVRESLGYETPVVAVKTLEQIPIVRHMLNDDNYGTYDLNVETGNGIRASEIGSLKEVGGPDAEGPVNVKSGSFSYTSPEGIPITTNWVADENGYRATGAHLPRPPPIPAEIARSLHAPSSYGGYSSAPVVAAPLPTFRVSSGAYHHEPSFLLKSGY